MCVCSKVITTQNAGDGLTKDWQLAHTQRSPLRIPPTVFYIANVDHPVQNLFKNSSEHMRALAFTANFISLISLSISSIK
jgi:hypothetical protein